MIVVYRDNLFCAKEDAKRVAVAIASAQSIDPDEGVRWDEATQSWIISNPDDLSPGKPVGSVSCR